jgi:uncharacterized protein YeaO (DUF488 family)
MLYTKSIHKLPEKSDGRRISVMSRHTQNDGKTPDPMIQAYDAWYRQLAPPDKLVGDYYLRGLSWDAFSVGYTNYIRKKGIDVLVRRLAQEALASDITILCVEETADKCHRRILAEECQRYEPSLVVEHR